MPGPPPVVTTKRWRLAGIWSRPFGQQAGQLARVFVVASHVDGGLGAFHDALSLACCAAEAGAVVAEFGQTVRGVVVAVNAGGAEEYDRVLDLFAPEARERLAVLGQQAQNSAVRTVEKWLVLISKGSGLEFVIGHKIVDRHWSLSMVIAVVEYYMALAQGVVRERPTTQRPTTECLHSSRY